MTLGKGGSVSPATREIAGPPGVVGSFQSDTPRKTLGGDHISSSSRNGSRGLEISSIGGWTFMAAPRVPETPQEINEWLKGTISVSKATPDAIQGKF